MSQSASQAAAFYREVAREKKLWTLIDDGGYPAPKTSSGKRSQPFWSSLKRVEKIIKTIDAYAGFTPQEVLLQKFFAEWLPDFKKEDMLIGVNWSGPRAVGYDIDPQSLFLHISHYLALDSKLPDPFARR